MACINSLVVQGKTLVWHTGLPTEEEPRTSSSFTYAGREWCLRFEHRNNLGYYHAIRLHRLDVDGEIEEEYEALTDNFRVHTHMLHFTERDKVVGDVEGHNVRDTRTVLWLSEGDGKAIFRRLDWLRDRPEVKFACSFPTPPTIPTAISDLQSLESLSADISGLLDDGILTDFELKCRDRVFRVHGSILAARSEAFRAMLRNPMQESETGSAKIEDMEVPVLESLLKFVYSGKLDNPSGDLVSQLYEAADRYLIRSLFKACSDWLAKNLTVDNCIRHLCVADLHSDPDLKAAASSFIIQHPAVFSSDAWLAFFDSNLALASRVLQDYATSSVSKGKEHQGAPKSKRARIN